MAQQIALLIADFLAAAAFTWLLNWLALLPHRRAKDEHWTERARKLWPVRLGAGATLWLVPVDVVLAQSLLIPELSPPWGIAGVIAFLGAWTGSYSFHRSIFAWLTPRAWVDQLFTVTALRFGWWFLFTVLISVMPWHFNWRTAALLAVYPAFLVIWVAGGLVWTLRKLSVLVPAPTTLQDQVSSASRKTNIPFRNLWLLHNIGSAAFAIPYTGDLIFSERLISLRTNEEVEAIAMHELAHLSESNLVRAGRLLASLAIAPCLLLKPVFHAWQWTGILLLIGAAWLLFMAARRFSRTLEKRADSVGKAHESDPGTYARALAAIHEDNLIPAVMARKSTHPDLYDRLVSVGSPPEYRRPKKPSTFAWQTIVLAVPLALLLATRVFPARYTPPTPWLMQLDDSLAQSPDELVYPSLHPITNISAPLDLSTNSSIPSSPHRD